ncbi:MAG: chemotaxis protein CheX [Acidobacteriia bacterium]|jgi:chemotaxis protein CheX|nr:chemotaxis protein CheX [Terriglobia bacterium]
MSSPIDSTANQELTEQERWRTVLCDAAKEVFALMVGVELSPPNQSDLPMVTNFTGMVGLAGDLCGILTVRCSAASATTIASHMLGGSHAEVAAHQSDAVGEISNMVAGSFKAKIEGLEDKCMLSVPTVVTGGDYEVHSLAVGQRIEVPLMLKDEPIWFTLEVRN